MSFTGLRHALCGVLQVGGNIAYLYAEVVCTAERDVAIGEHATAFLRAGRIQRRIVLAICDTVVVIVSVIDVG